MTEITVKEILYNSNEYNKSLVLRNDVLRKPMGMDLFKEDLHIDENSYHIGAFTTSDELIGILVLTKVNNLQIKMRQVAVNSAFRGQKVGKRLGEYAQEFALNKGYNEMTVHARESAVPFYEKLGFTKISDAFIKVTLPHYKMIKKLK